MPQGGAYSQGIGYRSQGLLLMIRVVRGFIHRGIIPTALIHFAPRSTPLALFQEKHLTNQWFTPTVIQREESVTPSRQSEYGFHYSSYLGHTTNKTTGSP